MRQVLNMQFVSKIKCCSPTYTRIHWEFLRLITRSRDPSRHNTLARAEAHTHSHSHTGRHSNERLKAHKQTARRRSDVGSIGTCVWCVCKYVCMLACNSACVQVCVCVCLRLPQFLGSLSRSHWLSHTRISLFATSLRFSYCCCYYYYYNYLLIQYLELFTAFNYSRYCA